MQLEATVDADESPTETRVVAKLCDRTVYREPRCPDHTIEQETKWAAARVVDALARAPMIGHIPPERRSQFG